MNKNQADIFRIVLLPIIEAIVFVEVFWFAYNLRSMTDGIPFVQLRIPYISPEYFFPFVVVGVAIWILTFTRAGLYSHIERPLFDEIKRVITYSFFWFFTFIGVVYLTQGFIFFREIPRLIIIYSLFLGIFASIVVRTGVYFLWKKLKEKNVFPKQNILILKKNHADEIPFSIEENEANYSFAELHEANRVEGLMRSGEVDAILLMSGDFSDPQLQGIIELARIYGVKCAHPKIMPQFQHFSEESTFIGKIPVVMLSTVSITPWERVLKRIIDIFGSLFFLILTSPIMLIAYIGIKIEDPSGPVIYRNRRIGQNGKIFTLYKFRYMYWKYSTKEDYLADGEKDEAIEYEEELKKTAENSRSGPLYKIQNDPRKMKFGKIIEKFSIDELPQLFNVLIGNMSIVGPRPHQPREVALYDESDKQVLTIKPGITGMAQVYGRDKNTFKQEVAHDIYYIENYSILLDIMIILRTILVVMKRPFEKK